MKKLQSIDPTFPKINSLLEVQKLTAEALESHIEPTLDGLPLFLRQPNDNIA